MPGQFVIVVVFVVVGFFIYLCFFVVLIDKAWFRTELSVFREKGSCKVRFRVKDAAAVVPQTKQKRDSFYCEVGLFWYVTPREDWEIPSRVQGFCGS